MYGARRGRQGIVTDTYDYDAFGNLIGIVGTTPNAYLYCGEQFDLDLGLYFLRARYMSGDDRRWINTTEAIGATALQDASPGWKRP